MLATPELGNQLSWHWPSANIHGLWFWTQQVTLGLPPLLVPTPGIMLARSTEATAR